MLCGAISSRKQQRSMFSLPQPTLSLPRPAPPVSYSTAFLPHPLQMCVGENVLLLLGEMSARLLRKSIFSYLAAWEGYTRMSWESMDPRPTPYTHPAVLNPLGASETNFNKRPIPTSFFGGPASDSSLTIYCLSPKKCEKTQTTVKMEPSDCSLVLLPNSSNAKAN